MKWPSLRALRDDPWLGALLTWLPPLLILMFVAVFRDGSPQALPFAVVDMDHSAPSRALIRQLRASPALAGGHAYSSVSEGRQAMQEGDVLVMVIIPRRFSANLKRGTSAQVTAFYNTQYLLAGKFALSALTKTVADFSAHEGVALRVAHGESMPQAMSETLLIRPQLTSLYNPQMNYAHFLVTAIGPAVWQLVVVVSSVLFLRWWLGQGGLPITRTGRCRAALTALWPVSVLLWLQGILMLLLFEVCMGWEPQGSRGWLWIGLAFTTIAIQSTAVLIVALVPDLVRALSVCAAYLAPAFAFMGVTFPRGDMTSLALWWGNMMPSTHYMQLQIAVADHDAPAQILWPLLGILLLFLLPLPWACRRLPPRLDAAL